MDEKAIIQGCREGNREAQRRLYELFADRVYGLLLKITRNPDVAFDLSQDTFVRIFERIGEFEQRSRLGTWVYRIATNQAMQWLRRQSIARRHAEELARSRDVHEVAEESEHDVEAALARLSEQHRLVLLLRYHEDLSYEEIAAILDVSPGTVGSRLNRAREELKRELTRGNRPATEENVTSKRRN